MLTSIRESLAWRNLTHDKRRLAVCVAGIAFAGLLMFMQLGFWNALLDASVKLIGEFNGDLMLVSKSWYTMAIREPLTVRHLEQARSVRGVTGVFPIYQERIASLWKDGQGKDAALGRKTLGSTTHPIRVIAFNPATAALKNSAVVQQQKKLVFPDTVLFDRKSKDEYGVSPRQDCKKESPQRGHELAGRTVHVVGCFDLGTDFTSDGTVLMSDQTFARLFPNRAAPGATLQMADVGVVKIAKGEDPERIKKDLKKILPSEVEVYTQPEFVDKEREFWQKSTPIGFIFAMGLGMGFIVGMVICYQILSADVTDHLPEYATLKAMGYSNRYLTGVVLQQALLLSLLGFVPALVLGAILYAVLAGATGLPLTLTPKLAIFVLFLIAAMCCLSSIVAIHKVQTADPAEVFG